MTVPDRRPPRGREVAGWKAEMMLVEGRVQVTRVGPHSVAAVVQGDRGVYEAGWRNGEWYCSCRSRTACSHLDALRRVVRAPDCCCQGRGLPGDVRPVGRSF